MGVFVDTQQFLVSRVRAMEAEMADGRRHINLLKQELSDAVRREHEQVRVASSNTYLATSNVCYVKYVL